MALSSVANRLASIASLALANAINNFADNSVFMVIPCPLVISAESGVAAISIVDVIDLDGITDNADPHANSISAGIAVIVFHISDHIMILVGLSLTHVKVIDDPGVLINLMSLIPIAMSLPFTVDNRCFDGPH